MPQPPTRLALLPLLVVLALILAAVAWVLWTWFSAPGEFAQGDRVVLVDPTSDTVVVRGMAAHEPISRTFATITERIATEEGVPAGSRARVSADPGPGDRPGRMVTITLADPPFAGMVGRVRRDNLRRE